MVGLVCYLLWGFLPLLFRLLDAIGSVAIVANRVVWSLLFVGAILLVTRRFGEVRAALADRRTLLSMVMSALLIAGNWLVYVYAVESEQLLEGSFGYFINPMISVAIGMVLLGERLNRWQTVSIAVACLAIALQALALGGVPVIALTLAFSFAFYGYFRKTARVGSASGLFVETLILAPFALGFLAFTFISEQGLGLHADPYHLTLLILTGPATALPLLAFAFAVQRLRLITIGMLQYLAPTIQFLLALFLFHEPITPIGLASFLLIWISLGIYTTDSILRRRG